MTRKRVTVPRTPENLSRQQREFFDRLPEEMQSGFLQQLPPLEMEASRYKSRARNQRIINERINLLRKVIDACEKRIRELNVIWSRLERDEDIDPREIYRAPHVPGAIVRLHRKGKEESRNGKDDMPELKDE
jgi:hypothetical protein